MSKVQQDTSQCMPFPNSCCLQGYFVSVWNLVAVCLVSSPLCLTCHLLTFCVYAHCHESRFMPTAHWELLSVCRLSCWSSTCHFCQLSLTSHLSGQFAFSLSCACNQLASQWCIPPSTQYILVLAAITYRSSKAPCATQQVCQHISLRQDGRYSLFSQTTSSWYVICCCCCLAACMTVAVCMLSADELTATQHCSDVLTHMLGWIPHPNITPTTPPQAICQAVRQCKPCCFVPDIMIPMVCNACRSIYVCNP